MYNIPDDFYREILSLHLPGNRAWLERLPSMLATCAQQWDITIYPPFANLSFNYVAPAMRSDGTPVVVKACLPTGEYTQEAEALRLFDGHGSVRLLESDSLNQTMLLESLQPGTLLSTIEDDAVSTSIAASVMRRLWRSAPSDRSFPTVQDWGQGFTRLRQHYNGGNGPFPRALLEEAGSLFAELSATMTELVLLHGDLHHENVLAAEREPWLVIDPKGLIGEPAYETGAWLRNPLPALLQQPDPGRILIRRIDQFAEELDLDRARIRNWAVSQAVLSLWWGIEDSGEFSESTLACTQLLAAIKP